MNRAEDDYPDIHHPVQHREDQAVQAITKPYERPAVMGQNGRSAVSGMSEISGSHTQPKLPLWSDNDEEDTAARHLHAADPIGTLYRSDILGGSYRPHFQAYYYKQWTDYEMAYHQHPSMEIMYMISGSCRIEIQVNRQTGIAGALHSEEGSMYGAADIKADIKKEHPPANSCTYSEAVQLHKGQFIVIDANVPHRLIVAPDSTCRMLNIEFGIVRSRGESSVMSDMIREEQELSALLHDPQDYYVLSDPEEVYYTLKSLVLELDQQRTSPMLGELLFAQLLTRIARLYQEARISHLPQSEWYVRRSIQFMHQNYDRSIRMEQIAAAVNVHPGYLHRIFKKHMHITPTAYLNDLRMDKAMMLLSQTDIPIPEIADYVGVASRQYFHLLFKKHTGTTPAEYRSQSERFVRGYSDPND